MQRSIGCILVVALGLPAAAGAGEGDSAPATPAQQYQALLTEVRNAAADLSNARTDEEDRAVRARLATLPHRLLALAEANPDAPVALEALIQTVAWVNSTAFPAGGEGSPGERALALLLRDHVGSDRLGTVCQQVVFGFHRSHETFLRAVLETSPHPDVQALACLSLAQYLTNRLQRLDQVRGRADTAARYETVFGKAYLEELLRQDRAAVASEAEALFGRAAEQYADVEIPVTFYGSGGTVGQEAARQLFAIRNLAVGRQAPDIDGQDQDGTRFRLSDYRGNVVLLYFWSEY